MIRTTRIRIAIFILASIGTCGTHAGGQPSQASAVGEAPNVTTSVEDPAADDMRVIFAAAHDVVTTFWGAPFSEQVNIILAPDRAAFDAGFPPDWGFRSECWMVGAGVADFLLYLSPAAWAEEACEHDPDDAQHLLDIAVHELTHVYHGQLNPTRDFTGSEEIGWFVEGLAVVVAGQLDRDRYSDVVDAIDEGSIPDKLQNVWSGQHRYAMAGSITDYIDKTYGRDVLYDLMSVTTEAVFLDKLGVSEQQLLDAWRAWLLADEPGTD